MCSSVAAGERVVLSRYFVVIGTQNHEPAMNSLFDKNWRKTAFKFTALKRSFRMLLETVSTPKALITHNDPDYFRLNPITATLPQPLIVIRGERELTGHNKNQTTCGIKT